MKKMRLIVSLFVSICSLTAINLHAQGTAFTYQGRLNNSGVAANGYYDLAFSLFNVSAGAGQVGGTVTNVATAVSNGLFTVTLDFGANFPGASRWLEIAVRTNGVGGYTILAPRQALTATPYAVTAGAVTGPIAVGQLPNTVARLNVADTTAQATGTPVITSGFITSANVTFGGSGYTVPPVVTVNAPAGSGAVITASVSGGSVISLNVVNAGSGYVSGASLTIAPPPGNAFQVFTSTNYFSQANYLTNAGNIVSGNGSGLTGLWNLNGNTGNAPGNFLGTRDTQPVEFRVNGMRALRIEFPPDSSLDPDSDPEGSPNIIGGAPNNYVASNTFGNVIGGGGFTNLLGLVYSNSIHGLVGVINGGFGNLIMPESLASVIGGGGANVIWSNVNAGVIVGGNSNTNRGSSSFIGAGVQNAILNYSYDSVVTGGRNNIIDESIAGGFIGGGNYNYLGINANGALIVGGQENTNAASTFDSVIGGGRQNLIQTSASSSVIAGGYINVIATNTSFGVIGGGLNNTILVNGGGGTIPGGLYNVATANAFAAGSHAKATNAGAFVWADGTGADLFSTNANSVTFRASGGVRIFSRSDHQAGVFLAPNGTSFATISDRNAKKDFEAVDSREILEKLAALPITQWHYKWEDVGVTPHIGPMAQDFKAAFYPGTDDTRITTQETDGVALAAIQGLNLKLEEARAENAELKQRLEKLEQLVTRPNGGAK